MKKLLLSLSTITLLTAPLVTVVACGVGDKPDALPPVAGDDGDIDDGGDTDSGGDTGSGGDTDDGGDADAGESLRPIMSEVELEAYLRERSFTILGSSGDGMGSGWLFDESDDYWYVATNEHVTESLKDANGNVMISNDWDRMHQDYNLKDYTYDLTDGQKNIPADALVNPMNVAEITYLFNDLRSSETTSDTGKVIFEHDDTNGTDFAVIQVPKVDSMIDPTVDPIEFIPSDRYVYDQYELYPDNPYTLAIWVPTYTIGNGNYRFGSFFKDTYVTTHNQHLGSAAWSPTEYYQPDGLQSLIYGFDHGPGSSGSASVDERGYFIMNQTLVYGKATGATLEEAKNDNTKYYHEGINTLRYRYWGAEGGYTSVLAGLGESTIKYP